MVQTDKQCYTIIVCIKKQDECYLQPLLDRLVRLSEEANAQSQ